MHSFIHLCIYAFIYFTHSCIRIAGPSMPGCSCPGCSMIDCSMPGCSIAACSMPGCTSPGCCVRACSMPSCSMPRCTTPSCLVCNCSYCSERCRSWVNMCEIAWGYDSFYLVMRRPVLFILSLLPSICASVIQTTTRQNPSVRARALKTDKMSRLALDLASLFNRTTPQHQERKSPRLPALSSHFD